MEQPDAVPQNPEPVTLTGVPSEPCDGVSTIDGLDAACTVAAASTIAEFTAKHATTAAARYP